MKIVEHDKPIALTRMQAALLSELAKCKTPTLIGPRWWSTANALQRWSLVELCSHTDDPQRSYRITERGREQLKRVAS